MLQLVSKNLRNRTKLACRVVLCCLLRASSIGGCSLVVSVHRGYMQAAVLANLTLGSGLSALGLQSCGVQLSDWRQGVPCARACEVSEYSIVHVLLDIRGVHHCKGACGSSFGHAAIFCVEIAADFIGNTRELRAAVEQVRDSLSISTTAQCAMLALPFHC